MQQLQRFGSRFGVLPGFRLTLSVTLLYLGLILALPLAGLVAKAAWFPIGAASALLSNPRTLAAFRVSFGIAAAAAALNGLLGLLLAWVLTRYRMPGRRLLDAAIDLPFALPTAVAGIALATLLAPESWLGAWLLPLGVTMAYNPLGIGVALLFVGLPFVVRTVEPVLAALDRSSEEAAMVLDASPGQIFALVIWPALRPAVLMGVGLAFARGIGEYGSVIFIAGNRPGVSEILPLLIVSKLEAFDFPGAAFLGTAMLAISALLLLALARLGRMRG